MGKTPKGKVRVVLMRHSERLDNKYPERLEEMYRYNTPITDYGIELANVAADGVLENFLTTEESRRNVLFISSPFLRCIETLAPLAKRLGVSEIHTDFSFSEWNNERWVGPGGPHLFSNEFMERRVRERQGIDVRVKPLGLCGMDEIEYEKERIECFLRVKRTVKGFEEFLLERDYETVVLCSHWAVSEFFYYATVTDVKEPGEFVIPYAGVGFFTFDRETRKWEFLSEKFQNFSGSDDCW